jgi:hypothetical protein
METREDKSLQEIDAKPDENRRREEKSKRCDF